MATAKTSKGQCDLCRHTNKTLRKYEDMQVCASCLPVLIGARNRPEALLMALKKFNNLPEIIAQNKLFRHLSDEAKRTAADNARPELSPEVLQRLENLERLGVRIREMDDLHSKVLGFCAELSDREIPA